MKASLDKKPSRPLTAADLCDRCSARAAVETVMMQGGSLLWCAHHFAFFEDALNAFGATILVDERRRQPIWHRSIYAPPYSPPFFAKGWPQYELDGLVTMAVSGAQVLLPLWHGVSKDEVMRQSPSLADKVALRTSDYTIVEIAKEITSVVRPG